MTDVSHDEFKALVASSVAAIPERFRAHLENVAFLVADEPDDHQLEAGGLLHGDGHTLLGLYEGIPLPARAEGYSGVAPDVITLFRGPHERLAASRAELESEVHQTVWHEVAHYFGLDHGAIDSLDVA